MTNFDKLTVSPEALVQFLMFEDNLNCVPVWCRGRSCEDVDGSCQRCL